MVNRTVVWVSIFVLSFYIWSFHTLFATILSALGCALMVYDTWYYKDKCVSCFKKTIYSKYDPINFREHYVEGAGQVCCNCWEKIYGKKEAQEEG